MIGLVLLTQGLEHASLKIMQRFRHTVFRLVKGFVEPIDQRPKHAPEDDNGGVEVPVCAHERLEHPDLEGPAPGRSLRPVERPRPVP